MNVRFWTWVLIALLNLLAVVVNTCAAIVTGSWVSVFFVVLNSIIFGWCVLNAEDALGWED